MYLQAAAEFPRLCANEIVSKGEKISFSRSIQRSAVLETIVFLLIVVVLDQILGDGHRFADMALHPFWIIILLISLQYSMAEGLIAVVLSTLVLLVGNLPEQSLTETMYQYTLRVMFLPFLWLVTALVMGSIRARQIQERQNMIDQLRKSEQANDVIVKGYNAVKQAKEQLELRLAGERCSILTAYKIAKSLETTDPVEAQLAAVELVKVSLNPTKFSLYGWEKGMLRLEVSYGWESTDNYARQFLPSSPLVQHILAQRKIASIANAECELIMDNQGMLAGIIRDEKTKKIFGMLKIEEIGFMELSAHSHETFRIVCEWIARMYVNVERQRVAAEKSQKMHIPKNLIQKAIYGKSVSRVAA